jgi:anaerobic sulfite reductase subunit C
MFRSEKRYFRMVIMGRTGKKNPRLAEIFIDWADEDSVVQIINNTYKYVDRYIDRTLPKEHIGYIVDRTGYPVFRDMVLEGVTLGPKTKVAQHISWSGYRYKQSSNMS